MYRHKNGLSLRKLEENDLEELQKAKGDSWATQHNTVFLSQRDQRSWFERIGDDVHMIAEVGMPREGDGGFVGLVSITRIDRISGTAGVGMMATRHYRGTGWTKKLPEVATDFAFEVLNLRRLEAEVLDNNPAAMFYDLAIGYQIEGRRRKAVYKCGKYHDSILIALLREEWEQSGRLAAMDGTCNTDYKERGPIERAIQRGLRLQQEGW